MDKITSDMVMVFLAVSAALVGFVLAVWTLVDKIRAARKPSVELQNWRKHTDDRLKINEDGNRVICRGILALLSHEINGNSVEKLTKAQTEITDFLIDK